MKNISLKKLLMLALLIRVAVPFVNAQVAHVGDILCTTGVYVSPAEYETSGLEALGVIFYVDETGQHGWAVALEDAGSFDWASNSWDTPLPNFTSIRAAIYDLNGLFNTQEVLTYGANNNYSFPAFEALEVVSGWYLPAIGQLNYLYGNIVEVNTGLVAAGGTTFDMTGGWKYWSSTELSGSYAWYLTSSGQLYWNSKYYHDNTYGRVRGARNF